MSTEKQINEIELFDNYRNKSDLPVKSLFIFKLIAFNFIKFV